MSGDIALGVPIQWPNRRGLLVLQVVPVLHLPIGEQRLWDTFRAPIVRGVCHLPAHLSFGADAHCRGHLHLLLPRDLVGVYNRAHVCF